MQITNLMYKTLMKVLVETGLPEETNCVKGDILWGKLYFCFLKAFKCLNSP